MKAISLWQPWASLIAVGAKRIETRGWFTSYRGPLAIHATQKFEGWMQELLDDEPFLSALSEADFRPMPPGGDIRVPRGVIVATCELVACVRIDVHLRLHHPETLGVPAEMGIVSVPPSGDEFHFGDYTPGRFAWLLHNIRRLPQPVPAKGKQGLWEWREPSSLESSLL